MSTPTEQIKERLPIAEVAKAYLKLEKAGRNLRARCPFHSEKTPSFFVSPERNSYYCFGCGAKGDIFTLTEHFEGVDFRGALELLGKQAGVDVNEGRGFSKDQGKEEASGKLYALLEEATAFFEKELARNTDACAYLLLRGLSEKTVASWRLGYAPEAWRDLLTHLKARGYSEKEIEDSGCAKKTDKGWYDRFRGRIMFPLFDSSGRVIAFSGRLFPGGEADGVPKYLNSPETVLFHKSQVLYGLDRAKGAIRKNDFAIVVEGQLDLLMSHQSGFPNTAATSGTSLTEEHLRILKRFSDNVVLAMDGDEAGIRSAARGAALALSLGMNVKVASLPKGKDPADIAKEDVEQLKQAVRESRHIVDFLINDLQKKGYDERKFRLMVQKEVFPFVARIGNRIDQAHFVQHLANRLSLPEEAVQAEVARLKDGKTLAPVTYGEASEAPSPLSRGEQLLDTLLAILLLEECDTDPKIDTEKLRGILSKDRPLPEKGDTSVLSEEQLFSIEKLYIDRALLAEDVEGLLTRLAAEKVREEKELLQHRIKMAEAGGDKEEAENLLKAYNAVMAREREAEKAASAQKT